MSNIGVIGLGIMGKNIALNMLNHGFEVSGYNRTFERTKVLIDENIPSFHGFEKLEDFVNSLEKPRRVFLMVPAGQPVDDVLVQLSELLEEGDIIMDGGNSYLEDISAKKDGEPCCTYIGPEGSGHYVKMVHNGIEYADMQLLAETYLILKYTAGYTNSEIADVLEQWNQGDVQSYLVDITVTVLREKDSVTEHDLVDVILDVAGNKGTGRWTSIEALRQEFNASLLAAAYQARIMSNQLALRDAYRKEITNDKKNVDIDKVHQAYKLAKTIAFAQGFDLYRDASNKYSWDLNLKQIAAIFRAGCIIQTKLLQDIMHAYDDGADDLLLYPVFKNEVLENAPALKEIIVQSIDLPLPVFTAALTYINQLTSTCLGANIIQGQRDFFGAHTYQRVDREGFEHHRWGSHE